jgi:HD-like signal output (HDOD) protein/ActR/RegA family two-component response regulator
VLCFTMKRIIFVDDETRILDGLRRMLYRMRGQWDVEFVDSGAEALRRLAQQQADAIITDVRMPGMEGPELLDEVARRYPCTMRIVLSGQCDQDTVLGTIGPAHQFLTKPCDSAALVAAVSRVCAIREQLRDPTIVRIVCTAQNVAGNPALHAALLDELNAQSASIGRVAEIVSQDLGMSAKTLQLVNSGFFGTPQHVLHPAGAVELLGLERLAALAASTKAFVPLAIDEPRFEAFFKHSRAVARTAQRIAQSEGADRAGIDAAFTGGLLHAVGILVLSHGAQERFARAILRSGLENKKFPEIEQDEFHSTYDSVGAYLLALWGLPEQVVQIVACHANPGKCGENNTVSLAAVHAANELLHESAAEPSQASGVDLDYLEKIGLASRLDVWRRIALDATADE